MNITEIGKHIRKEMDKRKWSVYKLSKQSGVKITPLQTILNATANYTIESLCKVCNALGIKKL